MDQLEDDTLICVLRLLAACDIGALARTQHAMADAVRAERQGRLQADPGADDRGRRRRHPRAYAVSFAEAE